MEPGPQTLTDQGFLFTIGTDTVVVASGRRFLLIKEIYAK